VKETPIDDCRILNTKKKYTLDDKAQTKEEKINKYSDIDKTFFFPKWSTRVLENKLIKAEKNKYKAILLFKYAYDTLKSLAILLVEDSSIPNGNTEAQANRIATKKNRFLFSLELKKYILCFCVTS